jgi:hypothetical protein
MRLPDYAGGTIANLAAELEQRLTGSSPGAPLSREIAASIPEAATYVVVLFDGLGNHQLTHTAAQSLRAARAGSIDAVFPTTTSVNLAAFVTASMPAQHGLVGHQALLHGAVINTLKWTKIGGEPVTFEVDGVLPAPNLWERLSSGGVEAITVQPGSFETSPLSRVLYRGCRLEPAWSYEDIVDATVQLAAVAHRLVFTYLPDVDVAAHLFGLASTRYAEALQIADTVWSSIAARLPSHAVLIGTADHGVIDGLSKVPLRRSSGIAYSGDPRGVAVWGPSDVAETLTAGIPATWMPVDEIRAWWGSGPPHPELAHRLPNGLLVPDRDVVLLPSSMDSRMVGYHGGLDEREVEIPLLIG